MAMSRSQSHTYVLYVFVQEAAVELADAHDEYAAMLLALRQAGQSTTHDGLFMKSKTVAAEIVLTLYLSDFLLCNPGLHADRVHALMPPREVGMEWVQHGRRLIKLMLKQFCINPLVDTVTDQAVAHHDLREENARNCVQQGVDDAKLLKHQSDQPPAALHPCHSHFPGRYQGECPVGMQPWVAEEKIRQVESQGDLRHHGLALNTKTVIRG